MACSACMAIESERTTASASTIGILDALLNLLVDPVHRLALFAQAIAEGGDRQAGSGRTS